MTETAHIFHPKNDSFEARIDAYRSVYKAWMNAEASLKFLDDDEWADTLGDREEVEYALQVSIQSMELAANTFSQEEISKAREKHLLKEDEVATLIQDKRKLQMRESRLQQQHSESSEQRQKR